MIRQLLCLGEHERFQQHQLFWRNVQSRQPYLDDWNLSSFWFLFHNIGIRLWEIGIDTAFLGNWDWICRYSLGGKGIIGETRTPTNGVKQYFGMRKPRYFASRRITRMVGPVSQELGAASE